MREQRVLAREMTVTQREKEMRTKLKMEFAESLINGLTGKK
jgi:hypothetical protein